MVAAARNAVIHSAAKPKLSRRFVGVLNRACRAARWNLMI
jgi:hypothetical protein